MTRTENPMSLFGAKTNEEQATSLTLKAQEGRGIKIELLVGSYPCLPCYFHSLLLTFQNS